MLYPQDIRWVEQTDRLGCFVAAMAMITGKTYDEVKSETGDFYGNGHATYYTVDQYLAQNGFVYARYWAYDQFNQVDTPDGGRVSKPFPNWPKQPFAPAHVCLVATSMGHFVVMLADGTVLDPTTQVRKRLADYERIHWITGVWKLGDISSPTPE